MISKISTLFPTSDTSSARASVGLTMALFLLLCGPSFAQGADSTTKYHGGLWGKLQKVGKLPAPDGCSHMIQVGARKYFLLGSERRAKMLNRLAGKFVQVDGKIGDGKSNKDALPFELGDKVVITAQKLSTTVGVVVLTKDKELAKHYPLTLTRGASAFLVPKTLKRKFKSLIDQNVEATSFIVTDGAHFEFAKVKSVKFRLLPGQRMPKTGQEAISGHWSGKFVVATVPSGVPGISKGDKLDASFTAHDNKTDATGSLFRSYKIVEIKADKKVSKSRKLKVRLYYSFAKGSQYEVTLEGTFSKDWKTYSGKWKSSFLGNGEFDLKWREPK